MSKIIIVKFRLLANITLKISFLKKYHSAVRNVISVSFFDCSQRAITVFYSMFRMCSN